MDYRQEEFSKELFEIASKQRISILFILREQKSTISNIAKKLEATVPEVFRNCERLSDAGLIEKDGDGNYHLTLSGETICVQMPSMVFVSQFKNYFANHTYGNLPTKFIQRIGSLSSGHHIKAVVKVFELWTEMYKRADGYIYNILTEVTYNKDLIEELLKKIENGVKIKSLFSQDTIVPNERKEIFNKINFKKYIDNGLIERRMKKEIQIGIILNEKEACVMFPRRTGDTDISEILYSPDSEFHEWCLDYFKDCWEGSGPFQERKLQ